MSTLNDRARGLIAAVCLSLSLAAQKGTPEARAGLEFKAPKGWVELPGDGDRTATLRLFAAPRALAGKDESAHTPIMRVMFFKKGGDPANDVVEGLPRQTPFRSLEDFAKRGLGAKEVAKESAKAGALDGQRVTAQGIVGDRMLVGQAIASADGESAVCFEVRNSNLDKLKKDIDATFASLAAVPRQAAVRLDPPWLTDPEWPKKDLAARNAARRKWAEEKVAATMKAPESGFKVTKATHWMVISAADPGFTKKAIAAGEAARAWCVQKLPDLTKDAPMAAVLRVFDSLDHYQAYLSTVTDTRDYDAARRELYFVNDPDNGGNTGYGQLFRAVLWHVLDDVDDSILQAMPRWLDNGCWEFMRSSRCDGKKVEFSASDVEKGRIAYYAQNKMSIPTLWDLIQEKIQESPTGGAADKEWGYTPECARLMRWLLNGDGLKAFDKPALLADYARGLGVACSKLGRDPTLDVALVAITPEHFRERNTRYYTWRNNTRKHVDDTVLPLSQEAWRTANDKWIEYNKAGK